MELAIDTSSDIVGIALSHKGEIMADLTWQTRQNHTTELLPNLVCLLQQAKISLASLEAIVVARGPGSFNGLRVGISTAKGLAFTLHIPLLGVDTLEAEVYPFAFTGLPLRAIQKAGRHEVATAVYRQKGNGWQCLEVDNLASIETVCHRTKQRTVFCGEMPVNVAEQIRHKLGRRAIIRRNAGPSRGSSLATLGWQRLSRGEHDDLSSLQPIYLRPPHITKPKQKTPSFATTNRERKQRNGNA